MGNPRDENIYEYVRRIKDSGGGHIPVECEGCDNGYGRGCMFCEGGLFACSVCNSYEGATTSECPGVAMTSDQSDAVYEGRLDYRNGKWNQRHSPLAPGWFRSEEGMEWQKEARRQGQL